MLSDITSPMVPHQIVSDGERPGGIGSQMRGPVISSLSFKRDHSSPTYAPASSISFEGYSSHFWEELLAWTSLRR